MLICPGKVFWTLATAQFEELNLMNKDSLLWSFWADPASSIGFTQAQPECQWMDCVQVSSQAVYKPVTLGPQ